MTRVVITGTGAVTNLGQCARTTWEGIREGRSGISKIEGPEFERYDSWAVDIGGQIKGWDPTDTTEKSQQRRIDRFALLGIAAAVEAVEQSGFDFQGAPNRDRHGVSIGSGIGGIGTIEAGGDVLRDKGPHRLSPFTVPRLMANAASGLISIRFGLEGPSTTHATACASSGHAMGDALNMIRRGLADVVVTGGAESAVTPLCVGAFMTMRALSTRNDEPTKASRPFDVGRDGFVLAEGAAMYVFESEEHAKARGATIFGEVLGYGYSSDATHITAPDEHGRGASRSMRLAMKDAALNPTDVDYINAHGTSTPLGDSAEVLAIGSVFGDHGRKSAGGPLLMSSTKSMHGHALGASGAVETVACLHAVRDGVVPATINLDEPDSSFDIDLVANEVRERPVKVAMNNTFGFGGHNVTLIIGRYEG